MKLSLNRLRVIARLTTQRVLRVAHHLAHALVGDAARRLVELSRGVASVAARVVCKLLELILQLPKLRVHGVFALLQGLRLRVLGGTLCTVQTLDFRRDLALLFGKRLRLTHGVLHVAVAASVLILLKLLLCLLDLVQCCSRLRPGIARSVGRRLAHRIGRVLKLPRCIGQVLLLLLPGQLFQTPRCFFQFLGQLTLGLTTAAATARLLSGRCEALLPLGFLLLPLRQFLQLLGQFVDLFVGALLFGALLHLVLVGQLVQLEFEQVG